MSMKSYTCPPEGFTFIPEMKQDYDNNGYILVKGLFTNAEMKHVEDALVNGPFDDYKYVVSDGNGRGFDIVLWSNPGNDVTGMVSRCEKMTGTCEKLLGGDVYHYHSKVLLKSARTAGGNLWHQDYGYWYKYGFLYPRMLTVFIAIDKCTKANGCLQVLKGSHKVGRIEHSQAVGQLGVSDLDRVTEIKKTCPHEYVEMDTGDALFFDCNLLHCSSNNNSDMRRWAFLSAFNKADNRMLNEETAKHKLGHGNPITKVPDSAILECKDFHNIEGKDFALVKDRPYPTRPTGAKQKQ